MTNGDGTIADHIAKERAEQFGDTPEDKKQLPLIVNEIRARTFNIKNEMYKIAELLVRGKNLHEHGEFQQWIEENFDFSYSTANNLTRVHKYCLGRPELVNSMKSSVLYRISSKKFPKDLRKYLFKNGNKLKNIKIKEIKRICKRFKEGKIDLESPEIKNLIDYHKSEDQYDRYSAELEEVIESLSNLDRTVAKMVKEITWPTFKNTNQVQSSKANKRTIKEHFDKIKAAIESTEPEITVVKKPKLKTSKKNES
jgi:hypothetical protein